MEEEAVHWRAKASHDPGGVPPGLEAPMPLGILLNESGF
jgi:hypothetical protein